LDVGKRLEHRAGVAGAPFAQETLEASQTLLALDRFFKRGAEPSAVDRVNQQFREVENLLVELGGGIRKWDV
jgi:hypothetical protein